MSYLGSKWVDLIRNVIIFLLFTSSDSLIKVQKEEIISSQKERLEFLKVASRWAQQKGLGIPGLCFLYESSSHKFSFPHSNICCKVNKDRILWRNIKSFCVENGDVPQGWCISTDSLRFVLCAHFSLYLLILWLD